MIDPAKDILNLIDNCPVCMRTLNEQPTENALIRDCPQGCGHFELIGFGAGGGIELTFLLTPEGMGRRSRRPR